MRRSLIVAGLLGVLAVHLLLLGLYWFPTPKRLWGDEEMAYWPVALDWSTGGNARLEPLWPPFYPRLLSLVLAATRGSLLAVQLFQTALLVASALLLRDLWRRLIGPGAAADAFALALLAYPPLVAFAHYIWPEVLHLFLFVSALWILALRRERRGWLLALGVVLGLAVLTKSLLVPFLPVLLAPLALAGSARARLRRLALVVLPLLVTVAPTVIANWRAEGVPAIAVSGRFNLWLGLNDVSREAFVNEIDGREYGRWLESGATARERNSALDRQLAELVRSRGVGALLRDQLGRQYFRLLDAESFLTLQLPGGAIWAREAGYRDTSPAVAAAVRFAARAVWAIVLVLAALGLAVYAPRGRGWVWMVLGFLLYNAALFLLVHVKSRYRVQLEPFLIGFAVAFVAGSLERARGRRGSIVLALTPARVAAGLVAAVLGLFLAFGGGWLDRRDAHAERSGVSDEPVYALMCPGEPPAALRHPGKSR